MFLGYVFSLDIHVLDSQLNQNILNNELDIIPTNPTNKKKNTIKKIHKDIIGIKYKKL